MNHPYSIALIGAALACLLPSSPLHAMESFPTGHPPVTRHVPTVEVYPQNFDLVEGPDSTLYVANHDGVLMFDGERWTHLALPNGDLVRSLHVDAGGRIYVGGYDLLGYLERDATGRVEYVDLTARFAPLLDGESFADIWQISSGPEGVIFRAVRHAFLYVPETGSTRLWRHEGRFGAVTFLDGKAVMQFRGEGLRRLSNWQADGTWESLPGSEAMSRLVSRFIRLPDGGLLGLAADGSWNVYRDGRVSTFPLPAGFPSSSVFTNGRIVHDNELVLTAQDGALWSVNLDDGSFRQFDLGAGYIAGLVEAIDGGLLLVDDEAVMHVEWPAEWTVLGGEQGLASSAHGLARYNGNWYTLMASGVQEITYHDETKAVEFRQHDWTTHEAWDLLDLGNDSALLAESYVVMQVQENVASPITPPDVYPRVLSRSRFDPAIVYVGTELGLAILGNQDEEWQLLLHSEEAFDAPGIFSIVQESPTELWLGSDRGGVMRVLLSEDLTAIERIEHFGTGQGIEYGDVPGAEVTRLPGGTLLATTARGIFRLEGEHFAATDMAGLTALQSLGDLLHVRVAPNGKQWAFSFNRAYARAAGSEWQRQDIGAQLRGSIVDIHFDADSRAILVASGSLLRHEPLENPVTGNGAGVRLTAVGHLREDGGLQRLPLATPEPLEFDAGDMNVVFEFALPEYSAGNGVRYSARLDGLESQWSDWSTSSRFTYYRLRPGRYSLLLRGRDSRGRITAIEPFRFKVIPPLYASTLALLAWLTLGALLLAGIVQGIARRRTRRLAADKLRLESMVTERTRELESANRQLEMMAHLDGLTEIPNRRKLDDYLEQVWKQCMERRRPVSLLVIDVDHFKRFNDEYGHIAGDQLLKRLARTLSQALRRGEDLAARYGGEEFLVVLPGADIETARELAEAMRERTQVSSLGATISVGIASIVPHGNSEVADLVRAADDALYAAKAAGRNCVREHGE